MKYCAICEQMLDLSSFHRNKSQPDGLQYTCKACRKAKRGFYEGTGSSGMRLVRVSRTVVINAQVSATNYTLAPILGTLLDASE